MYPYGATLSVMKPAVAVLSTGSVCFPLNRPVLGFYQGKVRGTRRFFILILRPQYLCMYTCEVILKDVSYLKEAGKLVVLGSCHMFSDQYIDKEENSKIMVSAIYI